ncbi:hypothetical protein AB0A69_07415 [Streptomyces sp. NPDC045431]|uniref:hypothetical protein n=1 Tax=Streptomyces sp. NPDC045431 TaxID=3155613 RepID=UPI0033F21EA0
MTGSNGGARYCVHCGRPIHGEAEKPAPIECGSGVRPDDYRHPDCGPRDAPYTRRTTIEHRH